MRKESNREILRKLKRTVRIFLYKNHSLEKFGKHRHQVVSKKLGDEYSVILMLTYLQELTEASLGKVDNNDLATYISSYLKNIEKFREQIKQNCSFSKSPLAKGVVRRMLTNHTDLYNTLLESDLPSDVVQAINVEALVKMMQTGVHIWNNDFKEIKKYL